jgi:hypothetical protein
MAELQNANLRFAFCILHFAILFLAANRLLKSFFTFEIPCEEDKIVLVLLASRLG